MIGNAVADAEIRFTPGGAAVANFRMASTPRKFDKQKNEWVDAEPLFLGVSVWRQQAENVAETIKRGTRVIVVGNLTQRQYDAKDGTKRSSYEIADAEVAVSLKSATATVTKNGSPGPQPAQGGYSQQQPAADPWATNQQQTGYSDEPPF
jgi:single-strand DNA-binding protein